MKKELIQILITIKIIINKIKIKINLQQKMKRDFMIRQNILKKIIVKSNQLIIIMKMKNI